MAILIFVSTFLEFLFCSMGRFLLITELLFEVSLFLSKCHRMLLRRRDQQLFVESLCFIRSHEIFSKEYTSSSSLILVSITLMKGLNLEEILWRMMNIINSLLIQLQPHPSSWVLRSTILFKYIVIISFFSWHNYDNFLIMVNLLENWELR